MAYSRDRLAKYKCPRTRRVPRRTAAHRERQAAEAAAARRARARVIRRPTPHADPARDRAMTDDIGGVREGDRLLLQGGGHRRGQGARRCLDRIARARSTSPRRATTTCATSPAATATTTRCTRRTATASRRVGAARSLRRCMPIAMNQPLLTDPPEVKVRRPAFRGIHVFVSGSTWDWFRPVHAGDQLFNFGGTESVVEKKSEFAERSLQLTNISVMFNQRAEVVAISRTLLDPHRAQDRPREGQVRGDRAGDLHRRRASPRSTRSTRPSRPRGASPAGSRTSRVGDALTPMAKGPLTTTDMIVFHAGGYGFQPTRRRRTGSPTTTASASPRST